MLLLADASASLNDTGLATIVQDRIGMQDCYRMFWGQSHLMGYEELFVKRVDASGGGAGEIREGMDAMEELQRELRLGASLDTEWFCVVAKRV